MQGRALISLNAIARSHSSEIAAIFGGIQGAPGQALWTAEMRATTRKDDPPEDDDQELA